MNERTYHHFERDQETPSEVAIYAARVLYDYKLGHLDDANIGSLELEQFFDVKIFPEELDKSLPQ